ncbi:CNOT4-like protein [Mya arenaria]|uniref:CNOT4-like protein n=1 Tax=Mya arenaria TaxID=6604 RepID=A0ABY7DYL3_MYAAR|nr:CNOT4-like protein [Mya arenaria]
MSGNDEQIECPLCMEPLEIDDINFFPCTCGYQICRFCWHRIRTDENGLCPACRKTSEDKERKTPKRSAEKTESCRKPQTLGKCQDCMYLHELGEEAASFTKEEMQVPPNTANKEAWPTLQQSGGGPSTKPANQTSSGAPPPPLVNGTERSPDKNKPDRSTSKQRQTPDTNTDMQTRPPSSTTDSVPVSVPVTSSPPRLSMTSPQALLTSLGNKRKQLGLDNSDNLSLFSSINGFHGARNPKPPVQPEVPEVSTTEIPDSLPVNTTTDWQAAFGFGQTQTNNNNNTFNNSKDWQDDDLGFDPLEESSRGLADLLEKESKSGSVPAGFQSNQLSGFSLPQRPPHNLPPDAVSSRMFGMMNQPLDSSYPNMFSNLLNNWSAPAQASTEQSSWIAYDPAILTSGNRADDTVWPPQTHNPPPGFQTHIRPPLQTADPHKLAEALILQCVNFMKLKSKS